jgi:hypothetical protein
MRAPPLLALGLALAHAGCRSPSVADPGAGAPAPPWFAAATACMACHDRLTAPTGEDVSYGSLWQASMMANAARDPYWHAAVRREVMDHPHAQAAIENECARCHMPMAHERSRFAGRSQAVFANLPGAAAADPLAVEGVSCSLCHQIGPARFGDASSFTGGFVIATGAQPRMFGPYPVGAGHARVMASATGAVPTPGFHVQRSELCATCHTLYTHALGPNGEDLGEFPEQVPYLEWLHSEYRGTRSCQACHMPVVDQPTPITSVLGTPRPGLSRHDFRGANFFVLAMFSRYRAELGVAAPALGLDAAAGRTRAFLQADTARVALVSVARDGGRLIADVAVENLAGHKLPTAYPSRRAWLHVTARDAAGRILFESGRLLPTGAIEGNDNDRDAGAFERHHTEIASPEDVQIYEPILGDHAGKVTTGLLSGVVYLKDNRVLPRGFDKLTAGRDIAVYGEAAGDPDFTAGGDRVRYAIGIGGGAGPFAIEAELWFQPIGYRWAQNLRAYDAAEPRRFLAYFEAMAPVSALRLAADRAVVP